MPTPRHIRCTARLAAAWFVLTLAATVISPWLQPRAIAMVCSASGATRLLVQTSDGWSERSGHDILHCPLCLLAGGGATSAPVTAGDRVLPPTRLLARRPRPELHGIHRARAPLPPRGPPVFS